MPQSAIYDLGPGETSADFSVPLGDTTMIFGLDNNFPVCTGIIEFEKSGVVRSLPIPQDRNLQTTGAVSDNTIIRVKVLTVGNAGYPAETDKSKILLETV